MIVNVGIDTLFQTDVFVMKSSDKTSQKKKTDNSNKVYRIHPRHNNITITIIIIHRFDVTRSSVTYHIVFHT